MTQYAEFLKARTIIAFILYSTFCYLAIKGKINEDAVIAVVSVLMGYYYGERKGKNNVGKDIHKNPT